MDLSEIAVDPQKETAGAEIKVDEETTLVIARFNNPEFRKYRNKLIEPYQTAARRGEITDEEASDVLNKALSKHVLLGWKGLKIEGKEIEYSEEKAYQLFSDPQFRQFREIVMQESQTLENFKLEKIEEDLGNSNRPSNTGRGGRKSSKKALKR